MEYTEIPEEEDKRSIEDKFIEELYDNFFDDRIDGFVQGIDYDAPNGGYTVTLTDVIKRMFKEIREDERNTK